MYLWAIGIALVFTTWPILGKFSGASGAWVGTLAVAGTLVTTFLFGAKDLISGSMPTVKAFVMMMSAGLLNGAAVYYYSIKTADPNIQAGMFVAMTNVSMVAFAPLLDWIVNGNSISIRQGFGIAAAALAVYLLKG